MTTQIRAVIERYIELVGTGPTQDIVDLYAADATVEDPVGTPVRQGHEAIREFYELLAPLDRETIPMPETVRIGGTETKVAAFMFTVVTRVGGQRFTVSPIDVMEFDDDGKITSMRAIWSQDDMGVEPE